MAALHAPQKLLFEFATDSTRHKKGGSNELR
jgi:hypothetical protein